MKFHAAKSRTAKTLLWILVTVTLGTSCAKHISVRAIIEQTPQYSITRIADTETSTTFLVYTSGLKEAQDVANSRLDCKKRICQIFPGGVILIVERIKK